MMVILLQHGNLILISIVYPQVTLCSYTTKLTRNVSAFCWKSQPVPVVFVAFIITAICSLKTISLLVKILSMKKCIE